MDPADYGVFQPADIAIHYEEDIVTERGECPQARIDEFSVDGTTHQRSRLFPLGCKHVGVKAASICRCERTACERCRCQVCGWGICPECRGNANDTCIVCEGVQQQIQAQEQLEGTFVGVLQLMGIAERNNDNV